MKKGVKNKQHLLKKKNFNLKNKLCLINRLELSNFLKEMGKKSFNGKLVKLLIMMN